MEKIACTVCEMELENGVDTYGPIDAPMCWACWSNDKEWLTPVTAAGATQKEEPDLMPIRP